MSETPANHPPASKEKLPVDTRNYLMLILFAGIPCLGFSIPMLGWRIILILLAAWIPALMVSVIFSRIRKKPLLCGNIPFSLMLALLLPVSTPLWMVALASAFSMLFAQDIFGGAGKQLVSPPLLAKLFLMINYLEAIQGPSFASPPPAAESWLWIVTGASGLLPLAYLLIMYRKNLFTMGGFIAGSLIMLMWMKYAGLLPQPSLLHSIIMDGFAFIACFLLLDPATSPDHRWARLLYGGIIALLAFAIGIFSDRYAEGMIIALLFGNLLAPLLDVLFQTPKSALE